MVSARAVGIAGARFTAVRDEGGLWQGRPVEASAAIAPVGGLDAGVDEVIGLALPGAEEGGVVVAHVVRLDIDQDTRGRVGGAFVFREPPVGE